MSFWCSAQTVAWDGTWRPYVGIWLFVLLIAGSYALHARTLASEGALPARGRHMQWFALGVLALWAGLDWPLGPLGAGYLASVHIVQFLLVGLIAPALMLLGLPPATYQRVARHPKLLGIVRELSSPLVALVIFNVGISVTHWPAVVDYLMATQLGAMTSDMLWFTFGLIFWWPVIAPVPERPQFSPLAKILYLAVNIVLVRPPVLIMLFAEHPVYATYELAPPIRGIFALEDQQFAGGIMKIGTSWILMIGISAVLYRWWKEQREV